MRHSLLSTRCFVLVVCGICLSVPAFAVDEPPAEHPVLGPEAAEPIERLLGKQLGPCTTGDIQLGPSEVRVGVRCDTTVEIWTLRLRDGAAANSPLPTTAAFVVMPPTSTCDAACAARRDLVTHDLLSRLRQGEAAIPLQRLRALPGAVGGAQARIGLAGTPTAADTGAILATFKEMPADATLLTETLTPAERRPPEKTDQPWLPIALLVTTAAALALRWWSRKGASK